ncbi:MAG: hypothetical protein U5K81_16020 [Trueperaceae bacterium]|nr:hypothetical protein [Trueperaceae bacterium]
MPVEKYASIEEMAPAPLRLDDPSKALRRMAELVRFGAGGQQPLFAAGVHKYPSVAEAGRARQQAEVARARALRQQAQDRPPE